MTKQQSDRT